MRVGFELIISGFENQNLPHKIINRSRANQDKKHGQFTLRYALVTGMLLLIYYGYLLWGSVVYIMVGTSRAGFLRDALMIWPAWLFGKRVVIHLRGGGYRDFYRQNPPWMRFLIRHTFAKVDAIIVLGELLRDQFAFVPDHGEKVRVIPNSISNEFRDIQSQPKRLTPPEPVRILYLSNMIHAKGYLDLLEACHILHQERAIPVQGRFCGSFMETIVDRVEGQTYDQAFFEAKIREYELQEAVQYLGRVTGAQKRAVLEDAHVFVLPTAYPWEGQPLSIIEALAFGTPVIATRYRGIPEQVIPDYNGYLVAPHAPAEIADAVQALWADPETYHQMSCNALELYADTFTQDVHLQRVIPTILGQASRDIEGRAAHD
jgi:glycosyltransferase involved in cell wall biosynthesis